MLRWQIVATAGLAMAAGLLEGWHGAASAAAGGVVSIVAGFASALVASAARGRSAGGVLIGALRAEAVKLGIALLLVWLVLANYSGALIGVFLGAFVVTMVIFSMAFFVRDY